MCTPAVRYLSDYILCRSVTIVGFKSIPYVLWAPFSVQSDRPLFVWTC